MRCDEMTVEDLGADCIDVRTLNRCKIGAICSRCVQAVERLPNHSQKTELRALRGALVHAMSAKRGAMDKERIVADPVHLQLQPRPLNRAAPTTRQRP